MEILITSTHLTVFDDHGQSFAEWTLDEMTPAQVWAIIAAVRRGAREMVEALAKGTYA